MTDPEETALVDESVVSQGFSGRLAYRDRRLLGALAISLTLHAAGLTLLAPPLADSSASTLLMRRFDVRLLPSKPWPSASLDTPSTLTVQAEISLSSPTTPARSGHLTTDASFAMLKSKAAAKPVATAFDVSGHFAHDQAARPKVSPTGTPLAQGDDPAANGSEAALDDGDGLRSYRLALAREARRQRHALAQGEQAESFTDSKVCPRQPCVVGLRLMLGLGVDHEVAIAQSSGQPALDDAALQMMRQAAATTPIPEALRGQRLAIELIITIDPIEP